MDFCSKSEAILEVLTELVDLYSGIMSNVHLSEVFAGMIVLCKSSSTKPKEKEWGGENYIVYSANLSMASWPKSFQLAELPPNFSYV